MSITVLPPKSSPVPGVNRTPANLNPAHTLLTTLVRIPDHTLAIGFPMAAATRITTPSRRDEAVLTLTNLGLAETTIEGSTVLVRLTEAGLAEAKKW